jgi:dihydrofolate reductase
MKERPMATIVMSGPQNITLDGVVEDPDGAEGSRQGDWFRRIGGQDLEEWNQIALAEALAAEAWLLGRRSYEFFGSRWAERTGPLADRLNRLPKYVVSSTLVAPDWNNSKVLGGDAVAEVARLKRDLDGEIVIPASYRLGRALIDHDLVDELRLVVFPIVLGEGERFFDGTIRNMPMQLLESSTIGGRLLYATCSINRTENESVVEQFLTSHPQFSSEPPRCSFDGIVRAGGLTLLPALHDSDGFFVAAFRRTA